MFLIYLNLLEKNANKTTKKNTTKINSRFQFLDVLNLKEYLYGTLKEKSRHRF